MTVVQRGKVKGKTIVFPQPLDIPEGTEVYVRVETVEDVERAGKATTAFSDLDFFGMWSDRTDMPDSVSWINEERATRQTRSDRRD